MAGLTLSPNETNIFKIVQVIIGLIQGRSNAVGEVTLRAGQVTTTVTKAVSVGAANVGADSEIKLQPKTASAAAAYSTSWISNIGQGTFTITHANAATTDRTFGWSAHG